MCGGVNDYGKQRKHILKRLITIILIFVTFLLLVCRCDFI